MIPVNLSCKKCGTVKKYQTSYLDIPIKFFFFCENEKCRDANGVVLRFIAKDKIKVAGRLDISTRPLLPVDLGSEDDITKAELTELIE